MLCSREVTIKIKFNAPKDRAVIKMTDMGIICSHGEQSDWPKNGWAAREWRLVVKQPAGRAEISVPADVFLAGWNQRGSNQYGADVRIAKAVNHMLGNINKPLRVSALSKLAGISISHFFQLFKLATGSSPNDFFIHVRMECAAKLLRGNGLSVKEVAALLGYNDQFYFSRLFKSVNGVPPREYSAMMTATPDSEAGAISRSFEKEAAGNPRPPVSRLSPSRAEDLLPNNPQPQFPNRIQPAPVN
jgi:AraC-like DNA-binding protein